MRALTLVERPAGAREWRDGWTLVLTSFIGFSFLSVVTTSVSVFMDPVSNEFRWSRTQFSSGIALASVVTACLSPFVGMLIDRFGSRRIALPGIILTVPGICAFALANGSVVQWIVIWLVYAAISISIKTTTWTAAVAGRFHRSRGLALGITLCGTAAAATILPPLSNWLIMQFGWRAAYVWIACGWGGVTLLFSILFLFDAHDRHASPDTGNRAIGMPPLQGMRFPEAMRSKALWRIALSTLIVLTVTTGFGVHQIAILKGLGVARSDAVWLAAMAGIAAIVGKLATGVLLDRFSPNRVSALTMLALSAAMAALLRGTGSTTLIVIVMLVNGYAQGTNVQIGGYLTVRYFGMKSYGVIYGLMNSLMSLGTAAGPILAAYIYDTHGDYQLFLLTGMVGGLVCTILLVTLPAYPIWETSGDVE